MRDFEAEYRELVPVVYRYLAVRAGAEAAEEITNDVFLAAARSQQSGSLDQLSAPWVMAVAKNKLVDHWRRAERQRRIEDAVEPSVQDLSEPSAEIIVLDSSSRALETLDDLPVRYRVLLTLRYVDDLSTAQVSRALGISEAATESALARARRAFRHAYVGATQ